MTSRIKFNVYFSFSFDELPMKSTPPVRISPSKRVPFWSDAALVFTATSFRSPRFSSSSSFWELSLVIFLSFGVFLSFGICVSFGANVKRGVDESESVENANVESQTLAPRHFKEFRRCRWSGWATLGATSDATWPAPTTSGYIPSTSRFGTFFGANQLYCTLERQIDETRRDWDVGARVDLLFGADYLATSSIGLETRTIDASGRPTTNVSSALARWNAEKNGALAQYGLALPQLYAELSAPLASNFSVKVGHWYLPLGYESIPAPQNFFYSHSYAMYYGNPQTATGLLATLQTSDEFSIFAGFSEPWNVWESSSAAVADGLTTIGGFERRWGRTVDGKRANSLAIAASRGDETAARRGETGVVCLVWRQEWSPTVRFVFVGELGEAQNGGRRADVVGTTRRVDANWSAVAGYVFVRKSETLEFGLRCEWFRDGDRSRIWRFDPASANLRRFSNSLVWKGDDYLETTIGWNWTPRPWLAVRPELRWDWSNVRAYSDANRVVSGVYNDYSQKEIVSIGGDVVVRF